MNQLMEVLGYLASLHMIRQAPLLALGEEETLV